MKYLICIFALSLSACASVEYHEGNDDFERLYKALGVSEVLDALGNSGKGGKQAVIQERTVPAGQVEETILAMLAGLPVASAPIDKREAKEVFRRKIMELMSPEEIAIAADFYSTKAGIKAHKAIIEAENSVSSYLDGN